ncbi:MAG: NAD-dependent succinate-semialdehyde dehydrogenase [Phycisphaerales bacterium]|nr:NAD-dependent succinate-semialdehyde dehydrogenase [Phycisphaerales bacterium]
MTTATTNPTVLATHTKNLIGGQWVGAASGQTFEVVNPATNATIASVPQAGAAEARQAVDVAAAAFPAWRELPAADRGRRLRRMAELMVAERERLATLLTAEQGKPLAEARGEITYAASFIEWFAEEARRVYGETIPASVPNKRLLVLRQPIGVTAAVTPWNFPAAMITRKLGPALAAGCTMVIKPAEETPLSALALAEIAQRAEIPAGVVNVVTGEPAPIVEAIMNHRAMRRLSFTGSTEVGKLLVGMSAPNLVRLSLELGGQAPFIVFDDADIDAAIAGAMASKFRNMGQTCICANRFFVQAGVAKVFTDKLQKAADGLRIGNGFDDGVQVGPLINDAAVEKVERHVADARAHGARIRSGGERVEIKGLAPRFFAPTVIEDVTGEMLVSREETFGPVAPVRVFHKEEEAIAWANDSEYGLAAYMYTRDASRLIRVAEALEYGIIGANDGGPSTAQAPFGGVKHSGHGREGGREGMAEYLETKFVSWGI